MTDKFGDLEALPVARAPMPMGTTDRTPMPMSATAGAIPIENAVLAMAYVPIQKYGALYEPEMGLEMGTLFPDLNKPFLGKKGIMR